MTFLMLLIPVVSIAMLYFSRDRMQYNIISVTSILIMGVFTFYLNVNVYFHEIILLNLFNKMFYVDALSAIMIDIVIGISFFVILYSNSYLKEEHHEKKIDLAKMKLYYILLFSFIETMLIALMVQNLGIIWIAIEATTIISVFLVGFNNGKYPIEAAWKYIMICSVGIAMALLGVTFVFNSVPSGSQEIEASLNFTNLLANASILNKTSLKLAFIFVLVGFGTKAGIAPMHTWLPDAHSQAPSPISAMLSGVLLNTAIYAILRNLSIVNKALGDITYSANLLIFFGVLSITISAIFLMTQRDYKRMLAYSSVEHMGIIIVSIALFTPMSLFYAIFHMINHSITKTMLFLSTGNVYLRYKTREIYKITGIIKTMPITGTVFLLGLFSIGGLPPFGIFVGEFAIISNLFRSDYYIAGILIVILLSIIFIGLAFSAFKMFTGKVETELSSKGDFGFVNGAVLVVMLSLSLVAGIFMPEQIVVMLNMAQKALIGG